MFQTGFSFPLSRLFRFRKRRAAEASVSAHVVPPPTPRRPIAFQPETTHAAPTASESTQRPHTPLVSPLSRPQAAARGQSLLPTPLDKTLLAGTQTPSNIVVEEDAPELSFPRQPVLAPVGPQISADGASLLAALPPPNTRQVSFQLPSTLADPGDRDRPTTPLSACSTLVGAHSADPQEHTPTGETFDPDAIGIALGDAEPVAELPGVMDSGLGRGRHKSLFTPQPARADVSRFSLPAWSAAPVVAVSANKRHSRRESRRTPSMPPTSGSNLSKREKRTTRWSKEMNKPETQEVLRALRGL